MKRFLLLLLLCISGSMVMAQTTWTGLGANSNWNDLGNWDTNIVPTATDDVIIPTESIVTLNVPGTVKSITIQGNSVFNMNTNLTFSGDSNFGPNTITNWSAGILSGSTFKLTNQGVINLIGNASKFIVSGTTLENTGTLNITSAGDLFINGAGAMLNNQSNGVIDFRFDFGNMTWSGTPGVINNEGLIKRTETFNEAQIITPLNNSGTIQVESGILSFQSSPKNFIGGIYNVFSGATLDWDVSATISGSLGGTLSGAMNWNSNITVAESTLADLNFSENFNWAGGVLSGGGTLTNNGVVALTGNASKSISGGTTVNNLGSIEIISAGDLFINGTDTVLNNEEEGIIDLKFAFGNITWSGTPGVINNEGLIKRTETTNEVQIITPLNNNGGTIQVETGILSFQSSPKNFTDGTYNVFSDATLDWDIPVTISGSLGGTLSGVMNWNSNIIISAGETADLNFLENFNWVGGTLSGGGTMINNGVISLTGNASKSISGGTIVNNLGSIEIISAGDLFINGADTVLNNEEGAVIDLKFDFGNITWSGAPGVINNEGLITRTETTNEVQIITPLNNNGGTIQVETGILSFQSSPKNFTDGTYNVFSDATLDWDIPVTISGSLGGTLSGVMNWNNNIIVSTGETADLNFSENFNWAGGVLSGGGTLINNGVIALTSNASKSISGGTIVNNLGSVGIISAGDLFLNGEDTTFNNEVGGTLDFQFDAGNITWSGASGILNNFGLVKRSNSAGVVQIFTDFNNAGVVEVVTGELEVTSSRPFVNLETGIIKGIGIFDLPPVANYTNNGIFAPGLSPGTLNIQGDFTSTITSTLDIELNGLTPDTEYDVLAISGNNNVFEGSVDVTMGFEGTIGDVFTIATTSGTIVTSNLQSPIENVDFDGKRYTFEVSYPDNNKVVLTIIDKLDILPPDIITQDITVELDATGNVSISDTDVDNGTTDNCTPTNELQFSLDITDFTCANLGDNTVTLTVTDNDGNFADAQAVVTVVDVINPTVVTQDITVELDATGSASILPSEIDNGSSDNCSVSNLALDISDFTCVDLGTNTVELTVTDQSGNSDSAFATVTVVDAINPTVVTQDITVELDAAGNASILASEIDNGSSDNCSVLDLVLNISDFTCADLGTNTVELTVTDQSGNSDSAFAIVTVEDNISPIISCPSAGGFTVENAGDYTLPDYFGDAIITVEDNCDFDVLQTPVPGTVLPDGDYTISLEVTDAFGNVEVCDFELKVRDTTLSVDDLELNESDIVLFPNPVIDNFTIKNNSRLELVDLEIIDVTGKIINKVDLKQMSRSIEIPLQNYANGVYFIKINALNNSITKRVIKQ